MQIDLKENLAQKVRASHENRPFMQQEADWVCAKMPDTVELAEAIRPEKQQ